MGRFILWRENDLLKFQFDQIKEESFICTIKKTNKSVTYSKKENLKKSCCGSSLGLSFLDLSNISQTCFNTNAFLHCCKEVKLSS